MKQHFYDFEIYNSPATDIPENLLIGGNEKKLLVVVRKSDFTADNKVFLGKVLGAVKFNISGDCRILVLPDKVDYGITQVIKKEASKSVLLFGINPKKVGLSIETFLYAPFTISNISFLIAHPLEKIKNTTENKKALWSALQKTYPNPQ